MPANSTAEVNALVSIDLLFSKRTRELHLVGEHIPYPEHKKGHGIVETAVPHQSTNCGVHSNVSVSTTALPNNAIVEIKAAEHVAPHPGWHEEAGTQLRVQHGTRLEGRTSKFRHSAHRKPRIVPADVGAVPCSAGLSRVAGGRPRRSVSTSIILEQNLYLYKIRL